MDSTRFLQNIDQFHKEFTKTGREDLARIAWSIRIYFLINHYDLEKDLDLLDLSIEHASRKNWKIQEAELYFHKGLFYRNHKRLVNSFENLMEGYEMMSKAGFEKFPRLHSLLFDIGLSYYYVRAYDQAKIFIRQSVEIPAYQHELSFKTKAYNTLGLCYMRLMQYDSAIITFTKSHDEAVLANMSEYQGLTLGNLGFAYFRLGNDTAALPLIEEDFDVSLKYKQFESATNAE